MANYWKGTIDMILMNYKSREKGFLCFVSGFMDPSSFVDQDQDR